MRAGAAAGGAMYASVGLVRVVPTSKVLGWHDQYGAAVLHDALRKVVEEHGDHPTPDEEVVSRERRPRGRTRRGGGTKEQSIQQEHQLSRRAFEWVLNECDRRLSRSLSPYPPSLCCLHHRCSCDRLPPRLLRVSSHRAARPPSLSRLH